MDHRHRDNSGMNITDSSKGEAMLQNLHSPHDTVDSYVAEERFKRDSLAFEHPTDETIFRAGERQPPSIMSVGAAIGETKQGDERNSDVPQRKIRKQGCLAMESPGNARSQRHRRSTSKTPRDLEKAVSELMAFEESGLTTGVDLSDGCSAPDQPLKRRLSTGSTEETSNPDEDANADNSDTRAIRLAITEGDSEDDDSGEGETHETLSLTNDTQNDNDSHIQGIGTDDVPSTQQGMDVSGSHWLHCLRANDASSFDEDMTLRRTGSSKERRGSRSNAEALDLSEVALAWREAKEATKSVDSEHLQGRLSFVFTKDDPEKGKVEIMKKRLSCGRERPPDREESYDSNDFSNTDSDEGPQNVCVLPSHPQKAPSVPEHTNQYEGELCADGNQVTSSSPNGKRPESPAKLKSGDDPCPEKSSTQVSSLGENDGDVVDHVEDVADNDLPSVAPTITTPLEISRSGGESPMSTSKALLEGIDSKRVEFDFSQKTRLVKSDHARIIRMLAGKADVTMRKSGPDDQPGEGSVGCTKSVCSGVNDENDTTSMNSSIPASLRFSGVASVCSSLGAGNVDLDASVRCDISRCSEADVNMSNGNENDQGKDNDFIRGENDASGIGESDRTFTLPLPAVDGNMNSAVIIDEEGSIRSEDEDSTDEDSDDDSQTEATEVSHDENTHHETDIQRHSASAEGAERRGQNCAIIQTVSSVESLSEVSARRMSSSQSLSSCDSLSTSSDSDSVDDGDSPAPASSAPAVGAGTPPEQMDNQERDLHSSISVGGTDAEGIVRPEAKSDQRDQELAATISHSVSSDLQGNTDDADQVEDDVAENDLGAVAPTVTTPATRSPETAASVGEKTSSEVSPRTALRQLEFDLAQKSRLVKSDNARIIKMLAGLADMTMRRQAAGKEGGGGRSVVSVDFYDDNDTASANASLPAGLRLGGAASVCSSLGIESEDYKIEFASGKSLAAELDARRWQTGGRDEKEDCDYSRYSEGDVGMLKGKDFDYQNLSEHQDARRSEIDFQAATGGMFTLPLPPIDGNMHNALTIINADEDIDDDEDTAGSDESSTSRTVDTENDEENAHHSQDVEPGDRGSHLPSNTDGIFTLPPPTLGGHGAVVIDADGLPDEDEETNMSDDEDSISQAAGGFSADGPDADHSPREPGEYNGRRQLGAEIEGTFTLPPPSFAGDNALIIDDDDDDDDSDTSTSETVNSDSADDDSEHGDEMGQMTGVGELQIDSSIHGTFSLPPPPLGGNGAFVIDGDGEEMDETGEADSGDEQSSYETIDSEHEQELHKGEHNHPLVESQARRPRSQSSTQPTEASRETQGMALVPQVNMTAPDVASPLVAEIPCIALPEHQRMALLSDSPLVGKVQTTGEDVVEPPKLNRPQPDVERSDGATTPQVSPLPVSPRAESPVVSVTSAPCQSVETPTSQPRTPPPRMATKNIPMPMTTAVTVTMPMTTPVRAPRAGTPCPKERQEVGPAWLASLDEEKCAARRDQRKTKIVDALLFMEDKGRKWWRDVRKAGNK